MQIEFKKESALIAGFASFATVPAAQSVGGNAQIIGHDDQLIDQPGSEYAEVKPSPRRGFYRIGDNDDLASAL